MDELTELTDNFDKKINNVYEEWKIDIKSIVHDFLELKKTLTNNELLNKTLLLIKRYNHGKCPFCGSKDVFSDEKSSRNPYMKDNVCHGCYERFPVRMMAAICMDELSKLYGVK